MKIEDSKGPDLIQYKDHYSIRYFILAHRYIMQSNASEEDIDESSFCEANGMSDSDFDYMTAAMDLLEAEGVLD